MKVKDIFRAMVDNYLKVVVEVFDSETHLIKQRYKIKPHSSDYYIIPEDVWNKEVGMVVVHFDSFMIAVMD